MITEARPLADTTIGLMIAAVVVEAMAVDVTIDIATVVGMTMLIEVMAAAVMMSTLLEESTATVAVMTAMNDVEAVVATPIVPPATTEKIVKPVPLVMLLPLAGMAILLLEKLVSRTEVDTTMMRDTPVVIDR